MTRNSEPNRCFDMVFYMYQFDTDVCYILGDATGVLGVHVPSPFSPCDLFRVIMEVVF
jgi:hypothetical protein